MHAGSAIGSAIGKRLGLDYRRRVLLVGCGTAAAVAAIFKAPVAGALFAIEILMIDFTAQVAVPLLVSSVTGALLAKIVSGQDIEFHFAVFQPFDYRNIPFYLILGALCALGAAYLRSSQRWAATILGRVRPPYARALIGGLALAPLILLYPTLFGEGYSGMGSMLSGNSLDLLGSSPFFGMDSSGWLFVVYMALLVVAKGAATSISGAAGGVGGIFAPSLFMGSVMGFVLARALRLLGLPFANELNFALVGMAGSSPHCSRPRSPRSSSSRRSREATASSCPSSSPRAWLTSSGRRFSPYSIYAEELARRNELVTHQKDRAALTLMDPGDLVEPDFVALPPERRSSSSRAAPSTTRRSSLPVLDEEGFLLGHRPLRRGARSVLLARAGGPRASASATSPRRPPSSRARAWAWTGSSPFSSRAARRAALPRRRRPLPRLHRQVASPWAPTGPSSSSSARKRSERGHRDRGRDRHPRRTGRSSGGSASGWKMASTPAYSDPTARASPRS